MKKFAKKKTENITNANGTNSGGQMIQQNPKYKRKKVEICWLDSKGVTTDWEFLDELKLLEPMEIISVGYLFDDGGKYKTIIQSSGDEQVVGRMTIPVCSIISITELKYVKKPKKGINRV